MSTEISTERATALALAAYRELTKNGLLQLPRLGEPDLPYYRVLMDAVDALSAAVHATHDDGNGALRDARNMVERLAADSRATVKIRKHAIVAHRLIVQAEMITDLIGVLRVDNARVEA